MFWVLVTVSEKMVKFFSVSEKKVTFQNPCQRKVSKISNEKSEKRVTFLSIGMSMVCIPYLD